MRRSSWSAMPWATSLASTSGFLISTMLSDTSELVIPPSVFLSRSMSVPFLPMITPGRAA